MKRKRSTKILPRKFEPAVCRSRKREAQTPNLSASFFTSAKAMPTKEKVASRE
jgi:hypothetical protein